MDPSRNRQYDSYAPPSSAPHHRSQDASRRDDDRGEYRAYRGEAGHRPSRGSDASEHAQHHGSNHYDPRRSDISSEMRRGGAGAGGEHERWSSRPSMSMHRHVHSGQAYAAEHPMHPAQMPRPSYSSGPPHTQQKYHSYSAASQQQHPYMAPHQPLYGAPALGQQPLLPHFYAAHPNHPLASHSTMPPVVGFSGNPPTAFAVPTTLLPVHHQYQPPTVARSMQPFVVEYPPSSLPPLQTDASIHAASATPHGPSVAHLSLPFIPTLNPNQQPAPGNALHSPLPSAVPPRLSKTPEVHIRLPALTAEQIDNRPAFAVALDAEIATLVAKRKALTKARSELDRALLQAEFEMLHAERDVKRLAETEEYIQVQLDHLDNIPV